VRFATPWLAWRRIVKRLGYWLEYSNTGIPITLGIALAFVTVF